MFSVAENSQVVCSPIIFDLRLDSEKSSCHGVVHNPLPEKEILDVCLLGLKVESMMKFSSLIETFLNK